ncbi:MAG: hypothetical protein U0T56_03025 [Ferruginibacter sp.]
MARKPQRVAQYIVKNDLASFLGTDLHHDRHMQALSDPRNRRLFDKFLSHRNGMPAAPSNPTIK